MSTIQWFAHSASGLAIEFLECGCGISLSDRLPRFACPLRSDRVDGFTRVCLINVRGCARSIPRNGHVFTSLRIVLFLAFRGLLARRAGVAGRVHARLIWWLGIGRPLLRDPLSDLRLRCFVRAVSGKVSQKNLIIGVVGAVVAVAGIALLWKKCTSSLLAFCLLGNCSWRPFLQLGGSWLVLHCLSGRRLQGLLRRRVQDLRQGLQVHQGEGILYEGVPAPIRT